MMKHFYFIRKNKSLEYNICMHKTLVRHKCKKRIKILVFNNMVTIPTLFAAIMNV